MDETTLRQVLDDVGSGVISPDEAVNRLRRLPFVDLGFAKVDHHRALRQGMPEAVYAPGKTPEWCSSIVAELLAETGSGPVLLTRANAEQATTALAHNPRGHRHLLGDDQELSTVVWRPVPERPGHVLVITAGTADLPVAQECVTTLSAHGLRSSLVADCGVAGVHRLVATLDDLHKADAVVVVAGMEGALASLVAGLVSAPVVAVPTSVGYGAALEGITALLSMTASCTAGVSVVGIDNGFGAACAIARFLR